MRRGARGGQTGLFVVLNLTVVFGLMGLSVDVGMGYLGREQAQAAADAAATGAAVYASQNGFACGTGGVVCGAATTCAYPNVSPATNNMQAGCLYAAANGFYNTGKQTVSMSGNVSSAATPPGVSGNSPTYWVQATVTQRTSAFFGLFANMGGFNINAVATAGVTSMPPSSCIYVLATGSVSDAFFLTGGVTVTTSGCGIYVDSSSGTAFQVTNGSHVVSSVINVVGGSSIASGSSASPTPTTGVTAFTDPLINLPMPTFSGCNQTNYSAGSGQTLTLNPGVYCGGMNIGGGAKVTLNSGMYVLNGGGLTVNNGATLTGAGVTFFNTGQGGHTIAPIDIAGGVPITLSAQTSGTYQGILFIQDRNLTYTTTNTFDNGSSSVLTGTLYFPSTGINYAGGTTQSYTAIIAKTLTFSNGASIKNDTTGAFTGLATHGASLIN